jgi:exodeoxyribonuclease-3
VKIVSWNVNGLRAAHGKGFLPWLGSSGADVVGVQEVRALPEQLPEEVREPEGWNTHFVAAERKGYSGVGLYTRAKPDEVQEGLGIPELDVEGRLQTARFGRLWIVNGYFPNGNGKERDNSRVPFKLAFYSALFAHLEPLARAGEPVLVMGDFNTAHTEIDLARPKTNQQTSGFLPEEREELDRWLREGYTDTFRSFVPDGGHYTWWSQRFGVRERNIGWRIDYILANGAAQPFVKAASIHPEVMGSDHCPISVQMDPAVLSVAVAPRKKRREAKTGTDAA